MALMIRSSAIHAAGCYTTVAIRKGALVAEYTGYPLSKEEADRTYDASAAVTYLFGLGDGSMVIDGHSMAMFINHSCRPNCETEEDEGRVWIKAIRNIAAGEEITYDYCLYDGGEDEARCNCGVEKCRGTMYSREEVKNRRAAQEKSGGKSAQLNGRHSRTRKTKSAGTKRSSAKSSGVKSPGARQPGARQR
jgi:hypothetical protein